jgi:hypothetical protein
MSFWSSLTLARAAPPLVVTARAIGSFIGDLLAAGALKDNEKPQCQFKYGPRVDADEKGTDLFPRVERQNAEIRVSLRINVSSGLKADCPIRWTI